MREKFARFMYGRYGIDKLGYALIIGSMIITLLTSLTGGDGNIVSMALLIWEAYRFLSRDVYKRSRENQKFLSISAGIKKKLSLLKNKLRDRKTHRYFECTTCHNTLRVPKGKGEIRVTCPVCKTVTITKT
ncbi:MAG: hypothetical protein J6V93_03030 [Clostridia bacterium]|nr:hypothetical protein [Clostridia bacterium]